MIILFEEYLYSLAQIENLLSEKYYDDLKNSYCKINYVGYYFDASRHASPIIILPKVFINEDGYAFGSYPPAEFLAIENNKNLQESLRKEHKLAFLYSISTWLHLSIKKFNDRKSASNITDVSELNQVVSSFGKQDISELEIVRSLIQFNQEHQQLFTFIKKTNASQNRKTAYFQTETPLYLDTLTKQKTVNVDEELIVIFYSVLASINQKYFLKIPLNPLYKVLSAREFEAFMRHGTRVLKQIKYRYFSDKLLKMWHLLYAYFERQEQIKSQRSKKEFLLAKDFNIVFEDMVDALLAEPNLPKQLKEQNDGKIIDHIYPYQDLLTDQDLVYHIADSKYYGASAKLSKHDQAKQYTYAKNVIQYNIDWLNEDKNTGNIRYRDALTEGYNITPNFFISAFVNDNLDFKEDGLKFKKNFKRNNHFTNRLFDRDTLILQAYNINFLFVLSAYVQNSNHQKETFKKHTRKQFRAKLVQYLTDKFEFRKIIVATDIEAFVEQNFKKLQGKIYRPSGWENELILATEKGTAFLGDLQNCTIEIYELRA